MFSGRRPLFWLLIAVVLLAAGATVSFRNNARAKAVRDLTAAREAMARQDLFTALRPIKLSNCTLERFGEKNDGGYLLCANLLGAVQSGYSYGINGYDGWGCDVSSKLN